MPLDRDDLLRMYRYMRLTRAIEDRTRALYYAGKIVGGVYTGTGIEATSVGAAYALRPGDVLAPLHRDLGAHLVRGTTPREVFAQWLARGDSPTLGRDGGLHFGDMRRRMIVPATGVVGASLPVAAGTALASRIRGEPRVTLAFIGEGGTSTGDFHEAMNLAASAWLPLVCVIEQNGYAYSTPASTQARIASFADRAAAYGIPGASVDGNDVLAVYDAVYEAAERARAGGGPALIEARTFRMRGHSEADPAEYVPAALLAEWAERDPVARFETYLSDGMLFTQAEKQEIDVALQAEVDDAVAQAEAGPPPDPAALAAHVFADGDGGARARPSRAPETPAPDSRAAQGALVPQTPAAPDERNGPAREAMERRWAH
jgi:TPP-dependent pyruvate/acetoin dehydrogenase alpha subunit